MAKAATIKTAKPQADPEKAHAMTIAALKAGTHGRIENWRTVCDGCRQWVAGIWWVSPDHKRLCIVCAPPDRNDKLVRVHLVE